MMQGDNQSLSFLTFNHNYQRNVAMLILSKC